MKKPQVLLVDDHSVVRMGLAAIINLENDLHVCGEAENGADAFALAATLKPDVVIMDLVMPGRDGANATAEVLKASPGSKVLILTSFGSSVEIAHALAVGATGAVTKDLSNSDLVDAIRHKPIRGNRHRHAQTSAEDLLALGAPLTSSAAPVAQSEERP